MVDVPTQTPFGLVVRMLLNPSVRIGTLLKINNASVQKLTYATDYGSTGCNSWLDAIGLPAVDGSDGLQ